MITLPSDMIVLLKVAVKRSRAPQSMKFITNDVSICVIMHTIQISYCNGILDGISCLLIS